MRFLSLCSGIEAASQAWLPLGWECAGLAEIDPFCCALLKHYYPAVPNLGDVDQITQAQVAALDAVDVAVFGFPCQDLSVAGQRKGLHDANGTVTRSGLFFSAMRVVNWARPRWVVVENVPGLFSSNEGRDFGAVVGELAGAQFGVPSEGWRNAGVALGPNGLVEWATLDAQYWNLAQRRERVFIVRDAGDWSNRPPLFLEPASLRGNPAPSRQAGKGTAPCISARAKGGGGLGTDAECDGALIAGTLSAANGKTRGSGIQPECLTVTPPCTGNPYGDHESREGLLIAHSLTSEGHDASEDGTGRGVPIVACPDTSPAIKARDCKGVSSDGDGDGAPLISVAFQEAQTGCREYDTAGALRANGPGHDPVGTQVRSGMSVRRLTPREVERLFGFPDDYALIPYRSKPASDGPRYRSLGNSIAVPLLRWIASRIQASQNYPGV